jgi:hypothetical protein
MRLGDLVSGPDPLVFAAHDSAGPVEVIVSAARWASFMSRAPGMSDADDRRNHAVQLIEARLSSAEVKIYKGLRIVRIR